MYLQTTRAHSVAQNHLLLVCVDSLSIVAENIRHQAALYGVRGRTLKDREAELLEQLGLSDRRHELAECEIGNCSG